MVIDCDLLISEKLFSLLKECNLTACLISFVYAFDVMNSGLCLSSRFLVMHVMYVHVLELKKS